MGICDSRGKLALVLVIDEAGITRVVIGFGGVVYDFAGPYTIGIDDMAFGKPTRYLQLDPARAEYDDHDDGKGASPGRCVGTKWDAAVDAGAEVYCKRMHNICCDNCHSHVARCLNEMRYDGRSDWNMVRLAIWIFIFGKHVTLGRTLYTWAPFLVLVAVIISIKFLV